MKKKIIYIIIIIIAIFIGKNIYIRVTGDIKIATHTAGSFISSGTSSYYIVNTKIKSKVQTSPFSIQDRTVNIDKKILNLVKEIDSEISLYSDEDLYDLMYVQGNFVYYFRKNISNKFYKYNLVSKKLIELDISNVYDDVTEEEFQPNIILEAMINMHPALEQVLIDKDIYKIFYVKDRIFLIEKHNSIYEYSTNNNKVNKIITFERGVNIDDIQVIK